jgi:hypothetical protein
MNPTHVMATGGTTAMLAQVLVWASHWPLQALDANTALAVAGLLVAGFGGGGLAFLQRDKGERGANGNVLPRSNLSPGPGA